MEVFLIALVLGIIPAMIAKSKGRQFFPWYIYGVALFIVAIVHAILLKDQSIASKDITPETHMRCPDCREFVRIGAKKCKHCGCEFADDVSPQAPDNGKNKKCPFCAETIKEEAIFCRFCQKSLDEQPKEKTVGYQKNWNKQGAELLKSHDYKGAIATCTQGINEKPTGDLYYCRAVAYSKMRDKEKTLNDLKIAADFGHEKAKETLNNINITP